MRTRMTDVEGMIALALQTAQARGQAAYLQPTYRGLALVGRHQVAGVGYLEARADGTVLRHGLHGPELVRAPRPCDLCGYQSASRDGFSTEADLDHERLHLAEALEASAEWAVR